MEKKIDVYQQVTDKIIAELENGAAPWVKPWNGAAACLSMPHNATTGRHYSSVNILLLWIAQSLGGYETPRWLTFKQCAALGGSVRKGEKGTHIVFRTVVEKNKLNEKGEMETTSIPIIKGYTVFNVSQCKELHEKYTTIQKSQPISDENDSHLHDFVAKTGAKVTFGGDRACYIPSIDEVHMPKRAAFKNAANFWATFFHELTHWTGHGTRLKRNLGNRFGEDAYAMEEMIAELGGAFTCASLGVENSEVRHAGYIGHWLKVLRADKRAIFTAASAASKAVDYLLPSAESEDMAEAA